MLQEAGHIKNTVVLIFWHIQCLNLMYFEVAWVLISSGTQVHPQIILNPDYFLDYFSVSYDYGLSTFLRKLSSWARIFLPIWQKCFRFDIYKRVINLDVLTELLVRKSNLCLQQNERNFLANAEESKAFIGVNYIMAVNQWPSMTVYCYCVYFMGNIGIQNIFTRTRLQVLQNLHFSHNTK